MFTAAITLAAVSKTLVTESLIVGVEGATAMATRASMIAYSTVALAKDSARNVRYESAPVIALQQGVDGAGARGSRTMHRKPRSVGLIRVEPRAEN